MLYRTGKNNCNSKLQFNIIDRLNCFELYSKFLTNFFLNGLILPEHPTRRNAGKQDGGGAI